MAGDIVMCCGAGQFVKYRLRHMGRLFGELQRHDARAFESPNRPMPGSDTFVDDPVRPTTTLSALGMHPRPNQQSMTCGFHADGSQWSRVVFANSNAAANTASVLCEAVGAVEIPPRSRSLSIHSGEVSGTV
jgi:hypothetical protein